MKARKVDLKEDTPPLINFYLPRFYNEWEEFKIELSAIPQTESEFC